MTAVAEADVWAHEGLKQAVVSYSPGQKFPFINGLQHVARKGDELSTAFMAEYGLEDGEDHTDYKLLLKEAKAAGAFVSQVREVEEERVVNVVVDGKPTTETRTVTRKRVVMVPAKEVKSLV